MVKLRTLGECVIEVGENRIAPDSKILFALLLYLGLERGRRFTRAALMEMFWPDSPPAKAAHSLRQTIYQLRKLGAPIEVTKTDILLREEHVASDLDSIERSPTNGSRLSRNEFLPSYTGGISETYSAWLDEQRNIVGAKIRRGLLTVLTQFKSKGDWAHVDTVAGDLLKLDPLNEEATLLLAEAAAMRGNKVGAVRILERFTSEVGGDKQLHLSATILRKRIGEQFKDDDLQRNPFVGRSDTLEFLNRQLDRTKHGEGSCLLVWGEPGIGKSRLVSEFHKSVKLQGFQTVKVECQLADANRPLSAFVEAVPALMELRGSLGCSPHSLALLRTLITHGGDDTASRVAPEADGAAQLTRAIIDLIDAVLVETPLLLLVEDVHWLDAVSWETNAHLAKVCGSRRLLVVATSREQYPRNAPEEGWESIVRLPLKPLADGDAQVLFYNSGAIDHGDLTQRDERWFIAAAEGNPYFVRELARHFADTRQTYAIPPSLESLLSARLRRVSSSALRLLQVCALLGRYSNFDRIEQVLQTESFRLVESLEDLELHELVVTDGTRVNVRHALLGDQAIQLCTPAAKRLLHRRIADVLEAEVLASNSSTLLWTCAEQLRSAGEAARATRVIHSYAAHLTSLGLAVEASEVLEQALIHSTDHHERLETLRHLSFAYRTSKYWTRTAEVLEDAANTRTSSKTAAPLHNDDELRLVEAQWFAESYEHGGSGWAKHVQRLLYCARMPEGSPVHRLDAARLALVIADTAAAVSEMDDIYESVKSLLSVDSLPAHHGLWVQAVYDTGRGDLRTGIAATRSLIRHYRGGGNVWELCRILHNSCIPLRIAGLFEEAERNVREAIGLLEQRGLWLSYVDALDTLGAIQLNQCHLQEAKLSQAAAASKLTDESPSTQAGSIRRLRVLIAIAENDLDLANRIRDPQEVALTHPLARIRDEAIATDIMICALTRRKVSADHITTLMSSHLAGRNAGRFDFNAVGLVMGLIELGSSEEALSKWSDYVNIHRREQAPISRFLQLVLLRFGKDRKLNLEALVSDESPSSALTNSYP